MKHCITTASFKESSFGICIVLVQFQASAWNGLYGHHRLYRRLRKYTSSLCHSAVWLVPEQLTTKRLVGSTLYYSPRFSQHLFPHENHSYFFFLYTCFDNPSGMESKNSTYCHPSACLGISRENMCSSGEPCRPSINCTVAWEQPSQPNNKLTSRNVEAAMKKQMARNAPSCPCGFFPVSWGLLLLSKEKLQPLPHVFGLCTHSCRSSPCCTRVINKAMEARTDWTQCDLHPFIHLKLLRPKPVCTETVYLSIFKPFPAPKERASWRILGCFKAVCLPSDLNHWKSPIITIITGQSCLPAIWRAL